MINYLHLGIDLTKPSNDHWCSTYKYVLIIEIKLQSESLQNGRPAAISSMKKKTVMKVSINGDKSKTDILTAVAKLKGVSNIALDATGQKLTVIGDVNPCLIAKKVKKTHKKMSVDILTVQTAPYQNYDFKSQNQDYYYRHTTNNNNNNNETTSYNSYPDCPPFNNRPPLHPAACSQGPTQVIYHDAPGECSIL